MPYPKEYQVATIKFQEFLMDVKNNADFGSGHMAYTLAQGVFQVFRRRLSLEQAILFADTLPVGLRALFVSDWNPNEQQKAFTDRQQMNQEVAELRPKHNFAHLTGDPINDVAKALRNQVDEQEMDRLLSTFPDGAMEFWQPHNHP